MSPHSSRSTGVSFYSSRFPISSGVGLPAFLITESHLSLFILIPVGFPRRRFAESIRSDSCMASLSCECSRVQATSRYTALVLMLRYQFVPQYWYQDIKDNMRRLSLSELTSFVCLHLAITYLAILALLRVTSRTPRAYLSELQAWIRFLSFNLTMTNPSIVCEAFKKADFNFYQILLWLVFLVTRHTNHPAFNRVCAMNWIRILRAMIFCFDLELMRFCVTVSRFSIPKIWFYALVISCFSCSYVLARSWGGHILLINSDIINAWKDDMRFYFWWIRRFCFTSWAWKLIS